MKRLKILFILLACAGAGWGLWSWKRQLAVSAAERGQRWVCPMRCLHGKTYDHPGKCPVCHMDLIPVGGPDGAPKRGKLLGYMCPLHYSNVVFDKPGRCPFCTLELSAVYEGTGRATKNVHVEPWQKVGGRTAVYFRAYTVQKIQVDELLRVAGPLSADGRRLSARLATGEPLPAVGSSAMLMPAQGYARPVLGAVRSVGPGRSLVLATDSQVLRGVKIASAEIRLSLPAVLAVPQEAVQGSGAETKVYVRTGTGDQESYEPRAVKIGKHGETYDEVLSGLAAGEVVAASGVFWLDAQWRMDHPEAVAE